MIVIRTICTGERLQTFLIFLPPLVLLLHSNCDIQMSPTLVRSSVVPVFVLLPILRPLLFIVVRFGVIFSATVNAGAFRSIIHGCAVCTINIDYEWHQLYSQHRKSECRRSYRFVVIVVVGCGSLYTQAHPH